MANLTPVVPARASGRQEELLSLKENQLSVAGEMLGACSSIQKYARFRGSEPLTEVRLFILRQMCT